MDETIAIATLHTLGEIPPNRCEHCDFCKRIIPEEGTVICDVMGFDHPFDWSPSKVNRCPEYQNLKDQWGI